jgi:hypothetical protein
LSQRKPGEEIEPVDATKVSKNDPQNDMPFGGKIQKVRLRLLRISPRS